MSAIEIALILGSYFLGGFCAAYYLVRWGDRGDIRAVGSGNAGATNAGRVLGKGGFAEVALAVTPPALFLLFESGQS